MCPLPPFKFECGCNGHPRSFLPIQFCVLRAVAYLEECAVDTRSPRFLWFTSNSDSKSGPKVAAAVFTVTRGLNFIEREKRSLLKRRTCITCDSHKVTVRVICLQQYNERVTLVSVSTFICTSAFLLTRGRFLASCLLQCKMIMRHGWRTDVQMVAWSHPRVWKLFGNLPYLSLPYISPSCITWAYFTVSLHYARLLCMNVCVCVCVSWHTWLRLIVDALHSSSHRLIFSLSPSVNFFVSIKAIEWVSEYNLCRCSSGGVYLFFVLVPLMAYDLRMENQLVFYLPLCDRGSLWLSDWRAEYTCNTLAHSTCNGQLLQLLHETRQKSLHKHTTHSPLLVMAGINKYTIYHLPSTISRSTRERERVQLPLPLTVAWYPQSTIQTIQANGKW